MAGWVKLHRGIFENKLWEHEEYSRAQAFIDLILKANHKMREVTFKDGTPHLVDRGELITSTVKLGESWGWDRRKVSRFLKKLEENGMIEYSSIKRLYTKIKIINYEKYQTEEKKEKRANNAPGANLNLV